jgi:hypothetical protein
MSKWNPDNQEHQDAYNRGHDAAEACRGGRGWRTANGNNPFKAGTAKHAAWAEGFEESMADDNYDSRDIEHDSLGLEQ